MTNFEDILDLALTRLQKGESLSFIANEYPEHREELMSLLSIGEMGLNIPKLVPPTPIKRRRFEEKVSWKSKLMETFVFSRVALVPIALLIALIGGRTVVNATESSLPGSTLYSLKRATEEARLTLTRNPDKLASIHMELMQKRVNEVRQAASSGDQNTEAKAIAELQSQTSKTFAEVAPVATANAISKQDSSLLDNLVAVNKQQKDVLADLSGTEGNESAKEIASTALEDTKKNDQTLAKIIATVNDQSLTDLPNKVSITGAITSHYGNKIVVEKNTFVIDEKTIITDSNNELITSQSTLSGRASIVGLKENGTIFAKQIVMLPDNGEVQGATTPPAPINNNTNTAPKPTPIVKPVDPAPTNTPPTPSPEPATTTDTPTKASGSFIAEPSSPEYTF
jgi:hypothetical protein